MRGRDVNCLHLQTHLAAAPINPHFLLGARKAPHHTRLTSLVLAAVPLALSSQGALITIRYRGGSGLAMGLGEGQRLGLLLLGFHVLRAELMEHKETTTHNRAGLK